VNFSTAHYQKKRLDVDQGKISIAARLEKLPEHPGRRRIH